MQLNWRKRLEQQPELADFNSWPVIIGDELPAFKRKGFFRNRRAIISVLEGKSIRAAANEANLSAARVSQLLARCLTADEHEVPALTKALIPGRQVKAGFRNKDLSSLSNASGARGSFEYLLLHVTDLRDQLDKVLEASVRRARHGQNLTPKSFHSEFLRLLVELGWDRTSYPFDQEKMGYEPCRRYFHRRVAELKMPRAKSIHRISNGCSPGRPYKEIQIDSQIVDINLSVLFEIQGQKVIKRISRVSLFMAIDVATQCIVAYHLCLTKDPTQADLLTLLENIHSPWSPLELVTPGLEYEPESCLPSTLGKRYQHAGVGMIRLDNALCHMSHLVRDYICGNLEATLNFGLPANPKGRNFIEYAFRRLNVDTHRFASTTGSHTRDPIREAKKNLKSPPLLTLQAFEEVLSVLITAYNVKPQERLGGLSPLDIMKRKMSEDLVRISFSNLDRVHNAFIKQEKKKVKCIRHENRRPHLNFCGLRYSGNCLAYPELIGQLVTIEYDIRDLRKLTVSKNDGTVLGEVAAPRTWQHYPFSLQTKKMISKETSLSRMNAGDPLSNYFMHLLKHKDIPKKATELVRVNKEFQVNGADEVSKKGRTRDANIFGFKKGTTTQPPKWSRKLARRNKQ